MEYEIVGTPFPNVVCRLNDGAAMHCESSAMSWMSPNMQMETNTGGGIGKLFGRAITGESLFRCTYTARGNGMISFAATKPGQILPVQITPQRPIVAQKSAFLAMESGVDMDIFFQKKLGAGIPEAIVHFGCRRLRLCRRKCFAKRRRIGRRYRTWNDAGKRSVSLF